MFCGSPQRDDATYSCPWVKTGSSRSTPTQALRITVILYRPTGSWSDLQLLDVGTTAARLLDLSQGRALWRPSVAQAAAGVVILYTRRRSPSKASAADITQTLINATVNPQIGRLVVCGNVSTLQSNFKYIDTV